MSYDFNIFYPSAQIEVNKTWPNIETAYPFKNYMVDAVCSLLNNTRWKELNSCAFLTVKYHNPKNLVPQQIPVKKIS